MSEQNTTYTNNSAGVNTNGHIHIPSSGSTFSWHNTSNIMPPDILDMYGVVDRLEKIEERLLILMPDLEKHEKYPALKSAYEKYLMIEKLVTKQNEVGK